MKKTIIMIITALSLGMISCKKDIIGEGPQITEVRSVAPFTGIDLRMNGDLYYRYAPTCKVQVTVPQSILHELETTVENSRLIVRYWNGENYDADSRIRVDVSGPDINSLVLSGSGSIYAIDTIAASSLYIRTSGSGHITITGVSAAFAELLTSMSGSISIQHGIVNDARLTTTASAGIYMLGVSAKTMTAKTSGSGDIQVKVADYLDATVNGSGSIYFTGYPRISSHMSGSGDIIHF